MSAGPAKNQFPPRDLHALHSLSLIHIYRVTVKVTDPVTDSEHSLLALLIEDPGYTMPQLSEKMGISRKTVAQRIKQLKEKGVIERIGSDRKGYWKINNG